MVYCKDFKDLIDKIEEYLEENYTDERDYDGVMAEIKKIESNYNANHVDQYTVLFDDVVGLDVIPNNYEAYKIINQNTDNSLINWGFMWYFYTNKLIFIPTCLTDEDKIKFLINLIKRLYPNSESYFNKYWKGYIDEEKKWLC